MSQQNTIFVSNLPYSLDIQELKNAFSSYGEILNVKIIMDRETNRSKGFGFVTFGDAQHAQEALNMHGTMLGQREIRVNFARNQDQGDRES